LVIIIINALYAVYTMYAVYICVYIYVANVIDKYQNIASVTFTMSKLLDQFY